MCRNRNAIKAFFTGFLHFKLITRHFKRLIILDGLINHKTQKNESIDPLDRHMFDVAKTSVSETLVQLETSLDGLTKEEISKRRVKYGLNQIEQDKPISWWIHLWHCYNNPFILLLSVLALVSFLTEDAKPTIVISCMIVMTTALRFWQERKSNKAADRLRRMVSNKVSVIRQDLQKESKPSSVFIDLFKISKSDATHNDIPISQLVPGDIVVLSAGNMIPADCRIIFAKDLFVAQSAITGESMPVEKFVDLSSARSAAPADLDNIVFMGTNVISGAATAVVIATGADTYFGSLAQKIINTDQDPSSFVQSIGKVNWLLIRLIMVMVPIVLLFNGFTKGNWLEAALFALSIAVGLTPEMLPMIVTTTLAKGAVLLSRKKVIVKHLDAIQSFGAMDVLCTDKTGTLTQNKIFLVRHIDSSGQQSTQTLQFAFLNSYYQTGLKNLLDVAVLEGLDISNKTELSQRYRKVDEIPFDFSRRAMSVVVAQQEDEHLLICKGAAEEVLAMCCCVQHGEIDEPLNPEKMEQLKQLVTSLNDDGLRVLAVAIKRIRPIKQAYSVADEGEMTLVGYVAFLDPPKESTAVALDTLKKRGIKVKILTGDNERVTLKICREVGLDVQEILLGDQLMEMNDDQLSIAVEKTTVFAKLAPLHKERIVNTLKKNGHIVGFLGDGINDAPALRAADLGISVDSAVDIAREAADIILLEKSLMVLENGVIEGRKTCVNMLNYIKMTVSSNFGNVFSVLIASVFLPFLPMLPMQLLMQNLLYDISQIAIPFDHVDEELIEHPKNLQMDDMGRFMLFFGPISSVFDIITYALMWFVYGATSLEHQSLFQSGWFVEGLLSQLLIVHMVRTQKIPFIQSTASYSVIWLSVLVMMSGIFLVMGPLAEYFKFHSLPLSYFSFLILILLGYFIATQLVKRFYIKKFGWH